MSLQTIENKVLEILKAYPETRSDDFILIYRVYQSINESLATRELFCEIMLNHKEYELPSFHSITRARRKVFEKYSYLKPEKVTKKREEKEVEFKAYALNT